MRIFVQVLKNCKKHTGREEVPGRRTQDNKEGQKIVQFSVAASSRALKRKIVVYIHFILVNQFYVIELSYR